MTNHRAGKTNTRDPRPWRVGKVEKHTTSQYLRRAWRIAIRKGREL